MTTASDIALYAINTGQWYKTHCDLAYKARGRGKREWVSWVGHVIHTVMPGYERETKERTDKVTVMSVCKDLNAYYQAHIAELDNAKI
jgi:hypothetical protein